MFLSCILKKPDVDDDDLSEDNHLKHDEEFLSRSERNIQGICLSIWRLFISYKTTQITPH